jgi:hypothetical protein
MQRSRSARWLLPALLLSALPALSYAGVFHGVGPAIHLLPALGQAATPADAAPSPQPQAPQKPIANRKHLNVSVGPLKMHLPISGKRPAPNANPNSTATQQPAASWLPPVPVPPGTVRNGTLTESAPQATGQSATGRIDPAVEESRQAQQVQTPGTTGGNPPGHEQRRKLLNQTPVGQLSGSTMMKANTPIITKDVDHPLPAAENPWSLQGTNARSDMVREAGPEQPKMNTGAAPGQTRTKTIPAGGGAPVTLGSGFSVPASEMQAAPQTRVGPCPPHVTCRGQDGQPADALTVSGTPGGSANAPLTGAGRQATQTFTVTNSGGATSSPNSAINPALNQNGTVTITGGVTSGGAHYSPKAQQPGGSPQAPAAVTVYGYPDSGNPGQLTAERPQTQKAIGASANGQSANARKNAVNPTRNAPQPAGYPITGINITLPATPDASKSANTANWGTGKSPKNGVKVTEIHEKQSPGDSATTQPPQPGNPNAIEQTIVLNGPGGSPQEAPAATVKPISDTPVPIEHDPAGMAAHGTTNRGSAPHAAPAQHAKVIVRSASSAITTLSTGTLPAPHAAPAPDAKAVVVGDSTDAVVPQPAQPRLPATAGGAITVGDLTGGKASELPATAGGGPDNPQPQRIPVVKGTVAVEGARQLQTPGGGPANPQPQGVHVITTDETDAARVGTTTGGSAPHAASALHAADVNGDGDSTNAVVAQPAKPKAITAPTNNPPGPPTNKYANDWQAVKDQPLAKVQSGATGAPANGQSASATKNAAIPNHAAPQAAPKPAAKPKGK